MEIRRNPQTLPNEQDLDYFSGLGLAILSSVFIGSSFIIKKISLKRLGRSGGLRAGAGGFGYLKDWMWWLGFITMGVGELSNFAAYAFAPASLVTPLGGLSVLVSAVLASKFLNENLNKLGKLGCLLCIVGSIVIVIHSPKQQEVETMSELLEKIRDPIFLNYTCIVIITTVVIIFYVGPRYGSRHVIIYILLCSAVGSITVMACKGLGLAIKEAFLIYNPDSDLNRWLIYTFFLIVVICITIQMNYLNKALDLFNTSVVTPIYYVVFTTLVIIASAILFKEWMGMHIDEILGNICGFLVIIVAIYLLHGFKDYELVKNGNQSRQSLLKSSSREYGSNNRILC